jgi:hypothetical protein
LDAVLLGAIVGLSASFGADIRVHVLSVLPYNQCDRADQEAMSTGDLLIIFLNWQNRLIPARARRVYRSRALANDPEFAKHRIDAERLISKIEKGDNLKPHLSKDVGIGYQAPTPRTSARRRDLDLMLNDWQVHHLHISSNVKADGFVAHAGPLLFAAPGVGRIPLHQSRQAGRRQTADLQGANRKTLTALAAVMVLLHDTLTNASVGDHKPNKSIYYRGLTCVEASRLKIGT